MSPIVYIGNSALGLSIGLSIFGMILLAVGRKSLSAVSIGRACLYMNFALMTVANLAMVYALLGNDFGVSYVSHVGSRETPRWISAISLWSSLEGSILLWGWILSAYAAVCTTLYREQEGDFHRWVGFVLLGVELFFFILLALPANPFLPVQPVPINGPGPNPLLQNHWLMAVHPPCLYVGYIGFTIPFAFAIATLLESSVGSRTPHPSPASGGGDPLPQGERENGRWIVLTRPWILFAWSFLSIAIVLGGWWSYAVLGWGGYWAWDPVENASFMPWLTATALIHSIMVQEKRKMLPVWNLSLAVLSFLLTLLGTFLTRSGVLDSVHSFTESTIGPYFLVFIGIVLVVSLALLLWRAPRLHQPVRFESLLSLEFLFLFNNLLFLSFCFVVFLGTWYPLIVEAVSGKRISVGEPYFNQMTVPVVGMILLLMTVSLATPWKKGNLKTIWQTIRFPALISLMLPAVLVVVGISKPWLLGVLTFTLAAFLVMVFEVGRLSRRHSPWELLKGNPRRYGGFISHTGALIIIVAVALSSSFERREEIVLKRGEAHSIGRYTLTLHEIRADETPQRYEIKAVVDLTRDRKSVGWMVPQMNFYPNSREPIGSPAIRSRPSHDLYLTLNNFEKDGSSASFKVIFAPAVVWIWIGGAVVMLGGLLALVLRGRKEIEG